MEVLRGRPIITGEDHPQTIYRALLGSVALFWDEQPDDVAFAWSKTAPDAWETLQDAFAMPDPDHIFQPDGRTQIYIPLDALEYALVGYGCGLINSKDPATNAELPKIDQLLIRIDEVR